MLVYVSCDVIPRDDESVTLAGTRVTCLGSLADNAALPDTLPEAVYLPAGENVWRHIEMLAEEEHRGGRRLLVVFGDAARDLALLGDPPDHPVAVSPYTGQPRQLFTDRYAMARFIAEKLKPWRPILGDDGDISGYRRTTGRGSGNARKSVIDVMQLGNLHHDKGLAHRLPHDDAARWLLTWARFMRRARLGQLETTTARQSMRSLRHRIDKYSLRRFHDDAVHELEYWAAKAHSTTRIVPREKVTLNRSYHLDFSGFYANLMMREPLPGCAHDHVGPRSRRDPTVKGLRDALRDGLLLVAEVVTRDGDDLIAVTPEVVAMLEADTIAEVLEYVTYKPCPALADWAAEMLAHRVTVEEPGSEYALIARTFKGLTNSLWGRLKQQNYYPEDITDDPTRATATLRHDLEVVNWVAGHDGKESRDMQTGITRWLDADGRIWERNPTRMLRDRYNAVGAHILQAAHRRMTEAMTGCEVVYAHTDSIYSASPIPWAEARLDDPERDFTYEVIDEEVIFHPNGRRYRGGKLEAHPGMSREGIRWTFADDPIPGVAFFTGRWQEWDYERLATLPEHLL